VTWSDAVRRSDVDDSLAAVGRSQHGLVTRAQALAVMSRSTVERRVRSGRLEPARRAVYRMAGAPETWEQSLLAACLAAGPEARASFRSAAALHELEGFGRTGLEITHFGARPFPMDGVVMHETSVFEMGHVTKISEVPVTSVARTLCDLTAVVRPWVVERAVDEALRRAIVRLEDIVEVAGHLEGRGRRRCTAMREILDHRLPGYDPGESHPERRIADLLVQAGLAAPTMQHQVEFGGRRYRIDLCYPELRIAIEFDSWQFHSGRQAFDRDRARHNDLVLLGFTVLHFTSRSSDHAIVDSVRAAIRRASRD
jgi:very-short-patch-repair endonuclease